MVGHLLRNFELAADRKYSAMPVALNVWQLIFVRMPAAARRPIMPYASGWLIGGR